MNNTQKNLFIIPKTDPRDAIVLKTKDGELLAIRKDAVTTVEAFSYSKCLINGIEVQARYDFVISALGWNCDEINLHS